MKHFATRIRVRPVTPLIRTLRAVVLLWVLLAPAFPAAAQSGFNWAATYGKSPAHWSFDAQYDIRAQFRNAIDSLMHHTETDGIILDFRFNTGAGAREG